MLEFAISCFPCSELWTSLGPFVCSHCHLRLSASLFFILNSPLVVFRSHTNSLKSSFPPTYSRIEGSAGGIHQRYKYQNVLEWMAGKQRLGWGGTRASRNLGSRAGSEGDWFRGWQSQWFLSPWEKRGNRKNIGKDKSCYDLTNTTN